MLEVGARGESSVEDDHRLETLLVAGESIEDEVRVLVSPMLPSKVS